MRVWLTHCMPDVPGVQVPLCLRHMFDDVSDAKQLFVPWCAPHKQNTRTPANDACHALQEAHGCLACHRNEHAVARKQADLRLDAGHSWCSIQAQPLGAMRHKHNAWGCMWHCSTCRLIGRTLNIQQAARQGIATAVTCVWG